MPNMRTGKDRFGVHRSLKTGGKVTKKPYRSGDRGKQHNNSQPVSMLPSEAENDPAYITSDALNATKYGSYATVALAGLSAVPVFVKALGIEDLSNSIVYGAFALAAVCVIAITVLIRTDLQVRGAAKVAVLESQHSPQSVENAEEDGSLLVEEIPDEEDAIYEAPAATVWTAGSLAVKLRDDERLYLGLAVGWNPKTGAPAYLVSKQGEKPRWVDDDEVQTASYQTDFTPVKSAIEQ